VGDNNHHVTLIAHDPREDAIRALAGRQAGNVSRSQLQTIGLSAGAINARLRTGALARRHPGVYALAPARHDPQARIAAAVLAGGPTALASHTSAAYLWGLLPRWTPPAEITITDGDRRPRHILTHRCRSLNHSDHSVQLGVKTTAQARTLLDLAPQLTETVRRRMVNDALRSRLLRKPALQDVLDRNPLHPGTKLLRPYAQSTTNPTNSQFEDDFLAFCAKYGLPTPEVNFPFNGRQLDAFFPEHGVIVELDGWDFHNDRHAFENDRERDADHLAHGLVTVRITKPRFAANPDREATRLQQVLAQMALMQKALLERQSGLEEG
jgi:hypothetical protein